MSYTRSEFPADLSAFDLRSSVLGRRSSGYCSVSALHVGRVLVAFSFGVAATLVPASSSIAMRREI
jgi:hypothetical protein